MGRIERNSLTFSSRKESASKETGGSIAIKANSLQNMVLEHIAQNTSGIIIPCSMPYINCFGDRNLDIGDVISIPDWLENGIGEAQKQNILRGFFSLNNGQSDKLAFLPVFRERCR